MESDQNRPQADGAERPSAAQDQVSGPDLSENAEFSGFRAERPQAGHSAHSSAEPEPERGFTGEPDFSGFTPGGGEPLLPRWLHVSLLWVLGLGAVAAVVLAGRFLNQERKTDKTLELLAVSSRSGLDVPAVPVVSPVAEKKPTDMVFLKNPGQTEPASAGRPEPAAERAMAPDTAVAAKQGTAAKEGTAAKQSPVRAGTSPAIARVTKMASAKAAPAKAKPIAKKKKPKRKKATAIARRTETQTWPRPRGDSITERLNAAVRACRARPHAPGECNLRACDILGSSDPACR